MVNHFSPVTLEYLAIMKTAVLAAIPMAATVYGHGDLTEPASRTRLRSEVLSAPKFHWPEDRANVHFLKAGVDSCPECSILEPVDAWPDLEAAAIGRSGPCGYNARDGIDYNQPTEHWGNEVVATYKPGEVIEVQWCVDNNGDHGGKFTYRMCDEEELVKKFLDPNYLPTDEEKQAAEDCFEVGILPCTDVDGQECGFSPDC